MLKNKTVQTVKLFIFCLHNFEYHRKHFELKKKPIKKIIFAIIFYLITKNTHKHRPKNSKKCLKTAINHSTHAAILFPSIDRQPRIDKISSNQLPGSMQPKMPKTKTNIAGTVMEKFNIQEKIDEINHITNCMN